MKRMAFVTPDLKSGGSERVASRLTHVFGDKYELYYIVFDKTDISYEIDAKLVALNAPPSSNKLTKAVNTFRRASGIRRTVREYGIDTVMSFTSIANRALCYANPACRTIASCRGFEHLSAHPEEYHRCIARGSDLLFNSREMKDFYLTRYKGDEKSCFVIENLIDCDRVRRLALENLPPEHMAFYTSHRVVCNVGVLSRHKGHWDLLKSFEKLRERIPDAGLVIVGHRGLLEADIKEMAARSKYADDILLVGYSANPFMYIAASEVYALSSISEGFPNAMLEAMCCGTPCVSTICETGPCELLYDDFHRPRLDSWEAADNGVAAPVFDGVIDFDYSHTNRSHEIFADALEAVLTDEYLRVKLSENGLKRAEKNDEAVIFDQYKAFFDRK